MIADLDETIRQLLKEELPIKSLPIGLCQTASRPSGCCRLSGCSLTYVLLSFQEIEWFQQVEIIFPYAAAKDDL